MTKAELEACAKIFAICYKACDSRNQQDITNAQMFPLKGATLAVQKLQRMHKATPAMEKEIAGEFDKISLDTMREEFDKCVTLQEQGVWFMAYYKKIEELGA